MSQIMRQIVNQSMRPVGRFPVADTIGRAWRGLLVGGLVSLAGAVLAQSQSGTSDPQQTFDDAQALGRARNGDAAKSVNSGTVQATLPNYSGTSAPGADAYSKNPTAGAAALRAQCAKTPDDPTCAGVNSGTQNRPQTYIRLDDKALAGRSAVTHPQAIVGEFSTTYNACTTSTPQLQADATYLDTSCHLDFVNAQQSTCQKTFDVLGADRYSCTPGQWFATGQGGGGSDITQVQALCEPMRQDGRQTFRIQAYGGRGSCSSWVQFELDMSSPTPLPAGNWVGTVQPHWGGSCVNVNVYEGGAGCQNGRCSKSFRFVQSIYNPRTKQTTIVRDVPTDIQFDQPHLVEKAHDLVVNGCADLEKQVPGGALPPDGDNSPQSIYALPLNAFSQPRQCLRTNSVCLEGAQTRTFDGKAVYKSCWRYENTFTCADVATSTTCSPALATHCVQTGSATCATAGQGNACSSLTFPLQCPQSDAQYNAAINCGPSTFCPNGSCYDSANQPSQPTNQFVTSVSYLAGAAEASNDLDTATMTIFKGKALKCKNKLIGAVDCCDSKTVLDAVGGGGPLMQACKSDWKETQELAQKREQGLCHFNWKWASSKSLGITLEESESYCCFTSKLGRIINEQGRVQIGKSWGSVSNPDNPDCSGFTVSELQRLDFSKIDFSEFYVDIKPVVPSNQSLINQTSNSSANCYYGAGKCQ